MSASESDGRTNDDHSRTGEDSSSAQTDEKRQKANNSQDTAGNFECNICLDTARDAVVSMCGHLFCWPCLHQWLETRSSRKTCPVCKAGISKSKVIPLYGRGNANSQDPREKVPPRPQGQRSEPENSNNFSGLGFGDGTGFQMSFGIGAFPFGIFAQAFNFSDGRTTQTTMQHPDDSFLSKVFLFVALLFFFWLIVA